MGEEGREGIRRAAPDRDPVGPCPLLDSKDRPCSNRRPGKADREPHGPGPIRPDICAEYKEENGHDVIQDFPAWEPCHKLLLGNGIMGWENVGGDIDEATGMRCTIAGWPIKWTGGDGSMVRLVAIVDKGDQ